MNGISGMAYNMAMYGTENVYLAFFFAIVGITIAGNIFGFSYFGLALYLRIKYIIKS